MFNYLTFSLVQVEHVEHLNQVQSISSFCTLQVGGFPCADLRCMVCHLESLFFEGLIFKVQRLSCATVRVPGTRIESGVNNSCGSPVCYSLHGNGEARIQMGIRIRTLPSTSAASAARLGCTRDESTVVSRAFA